MTSFTDRIFNSPRITAKTIFDFNEIRPDTQKHLKNVYSTLSIGLLAAAAGSYIYVSDIYKGDLLPLLGSFGLLFAIMLTPHNGDNISKRLAYFIGFACCSGLGLGPLLDRVITIDPSIIPTALLGSGVIFICFTLCALLSNQRQFLYLGGALLSGLTILSLTALMNLFVRSVAIYNFQIYGGFAIFCIFVIYDTQLIVYKHSTYGDTDFIWHALDLFLDLIQLFRYLVVILTKKSNRRED